MTDETTSNPWNPATFAARMQRASEEFTDQQLEFIEEMLRLNPATASDGEGFGSLGRMAMGTAAFKTRVQSGGRISIPDAEREALDIEEGDLVQTFVVPISRRREDADE